MKKVLVLVIALLMVLTMAVACAPKADAPADAPADKPADAPAADAPAAPEKKDITIAVIPKALDNAVYLDAKLGAENAAKEFGINVEWTASASSNAAEQVTVIEGLISKGVDGMLIACNDADALKDVINKAVANGIVVATFGSDSPDSDRAFTIGTDNYQLGKVSGEKMIELLPEGGKVAVLTGVPGAPDLEPRIQAFKDVTEGTGIEIASIQSGMDDTQKSVDVVNQYTVGNPDIDAWWFDGGWPFFADPEALPDLKAWREQGGIIVSVDTFYPMLQYFELGMADFMIGQDFYAMGHDGVAKILDVINGKQVDEVNDTGVELCDMSNYEEVRAGKTPW